MTKVELHVARKKTAHAGAATTWILGQTYSYIKEEIVQAEEVAFLQWSDTISKHIVTLNFKN